MMQHEILLALVGCPGNVFMVSRETGFFEVIPDLPFIHPSEVAILNRLSLLSTYYIQLQEFTKQQTSASFGSNRDGQLYYKAMACGLDKVLDTYRQKIVDVEQKLVCQPDLSLTHIQCEFDDFHFLLPALDACVKYVQYHKLQGCQILSYLHQQCSSGVTSVSAAFMRIMCACHEVFYKQLAAWMLHGLLLDQKCEFFIQQIESPPNAEGEVVEEDVEAPSTFSYSTAKRVTDQFRINESLAPSYIPRKVLEKILFIGEAVQIFQTLSTANGHRILPNNSTTSSEYKLQNDLVKFSRMLTKLQNNPEFKLQDFEHTIECIRNIVAQNLWKVLVEESNLVDHLRIMKDMFLLGRGELFLVFLDHADLFMKQLPTSTTQHDMNMAFKQAIVKIASDQEDLTKQFELTLSSQLPEFYDSSKKSNSWRYIGMSHTVSWPLHVVFTSAMLQKYSSLFHFLLSVRRAQVCLQRCWATLMRANTHQLQEVWHLRTHMGFLIDNLQYYVQVDVLETQYSLLLNKINSTTDFEAVTAAHSHFIDTLQSQLFFSFERIRHSFSEILELCFLFSELIQTLSREEFVATPQFQETLKQVSLDFKRQSSLLFRVLSTFKNHYSAPHIVQLLLRIDYNRYFTSLA